MKASTIRSTSSSLIAFAALTLVAAAQEDPARGTLLEAIREQGDVSKVQDLYLRVRYKSFKEGSNGSQTGDEGFLRQFYRPPHLFRVEVEAGDGSGTVETAKVYDGATGKGLQARINAADLHKGDKRIDDKESLEKLRDQVRPLRFLLLNQFLRDGSRATSKTRPGASTRKIEWIESDKAGETLMLSFEAFRLTKVDIRRTDGGQDFIVELSGHTRVGEQHLLFPTKATVHRKTGPNKGDSEKVLELQVVQDGLIVNPDVDGEIYESAAEETPSDLD